MVKAVHLLLSIPARRKHLFLGTKFREGCVLSWPYGHAHLMIQVVISLVGHFIWGLSVNACRVVFTSTHILGVLLPLV